MNNKIICSYAERLDKNINSLKIQVDNDPLKQVDPQVLQELYQKEIEQDRLARQYFKEYTGLIWSEDKEDKIKREMFNQDILFCPFDTIKKEDWEKYKSNIYNKNYI